MKLSILTPSYGYAQFIGAAIASAGDTGEDVEHIIMDGGSTDGTLDVLAESSTKWESRPDRGQSDALNLALEKASGEVVGWLNADDFYLPGALERVMAEFRRDPSLDMVYGDTVLVDVCGRVVRIYKGYRIPKIVLKWRGCVQMSTTTFFRRSILEQDPFDVNLREMMDWDLFLNLRTKSKVRSKYIPFPIAAFRVHQDQVTSTRSGLQSEEHTVIRKRYGISNRLVPLTRPLGATIHRSFKLISGAWYQEMKSKKAAGHPLLDLTGKPDRSASSTFIESCYRR